jgi:hypothetical protein
MVGLLLLLPTAYYYGARRAVVLFAAPSLVVVLASHAPRRLTPGAGWVPSLALVFAAGVLVSFYSVRQLGPETASAAAWALDAPIYAKGSWLALLVSKLVLYAIVIAPRAATRPLDSAAAVALLSTCLLIELAGVQLARGVFAAVAVASALLAVLAPERARGSLLGSGLLVLEHLYQASAAHLAPLQMLLSACAAALLAWRRLRLSALASSWANGLTVALTLYLMFWPTVGFHLVGIDFSYMFQWVPAEEYERLWWVIGVGLIIKLALPLWLVVLVGGSALHRGSIRAVVSGTLAAKTGLLALMIASYAVQHDMGSQQALAMFAELILVMFAACTWLAAAPARLKVAAPAWLPKTHTAPLPATSE